MRDVILKAADHIEQRPSDYCFMSSALPEPGRVAGCALGWVLYFSTLHKTVAEIVSFTEFQVLGPAAMLLNVAGPSEFYDRMDSYNTGHKWGETWTTSARICVASLRMYADEFHPE